MHYNCLIVDDEKELSKMTAEYFQMFGVTTAYVESAEECYSFLDNNSVDLILLDINLGDNSGFDVCKRVREDMQIPILFISARQSDDDVLIALSIGGDDYVKKPYSLSVLLAKVKVNLRRIEQLRAAGEKNSREMIESGRFYIDETTMSVIRDGEQIQLKAKEFDLIKCLYNHKNSIVKKEALFEEVWGDAFYGDGTLNVHIRKLREKLEENPNKPKLIKTVWGTGYMLDLENNIEADS
ncbi:response regulator transcription factor [Eubacterium xylanophilum]|uniref:response regulator transcription factor n=1 Tax=Eubacterium xylanophilum TaxID=39497 RepID=UPI00047C70C8|nr:response regulator transcription factor [Eubacterium xylanophilum]